MVQKLVGVRATHAVQDLGFHDSYMYMYAAYPYPLRRKSGTENQDGYFLKIRPPLYSTIVATTGDALPEH